MIKAKNIITGFLLTVYSLTIVAEGISPVLKASLRFSILFLTLLLVVFTKKKIYYNNKIILYLIIIIIPFLFSLIRVDFDPGLIQLLMYFNCIIFVALVYSIKSQINLIDISFSVYPLIFIFLIGGYFLDLQIFWRETFTDGAIRLGGYILNPNELGMLASIGCVIAYYFFFNGKKIIGLILFLSSIVVLFSTESRSSIIALMIALIFLNRSHIKFLIIPFSVMFILISADSIISTLIPRSEAVDDILTLTGRLEIWQVTVLKLIPEYFIFGAGWQEFPISKYGLAASMAHNTFFQIFVGGGIITFLISLYLLFEISKSINGVFKSIFIILIINSMTDFGFYGLFNHSVLIFTFLLYQNHNVKNYLSSRVFKHS